MKYIRIIPRLDIKGPNLVKGIHLEGLRVMGKPEDFAALYYKQGADELIYQDTVASLYQRNSLTEIITRTVENIFIPLTVGGGLRNLEDINKVLRAGADKVAINTAAINEHNFINQASSAFGSSTIVVAVEAIKQPDNSYLAYTDNGREYTGVEVLSWAKEVEERGAGEILLTSIDREGTGNGFDLELIRMVSSELTIPVIAHGGAANVSHIVGSINNAGADAVAIASMLHYEALRINKSLIGNFDDEGNIEFLKKNKVALLAGVQRLLKHRTNPKSKKKNRSRQGDILYLDKMGVKIGDKFEDEKGEILEIVSYTKYIKPSKDVPFQPLSKLTLSSALTTSFGEQYDSYHPWVQQEVEKGEKIKTGVLGGGYTREGSREDTWIELRDFEYVGSKLEKDGLNFIVKQGDNEKIISSSEIDKYFKPYIVLSYISKHDSKKIVCELFELMLNKKKKIYHLNPVEKDDI